jgi:hypothetical protein
VIWQSADGRPGATRSTLEGEARTDLGQEEQDMTKRTNSTARAAMVAVAATALSLAAAAGASAEPSSWLPNADLVCGTTTLGPQDWVAVPPSDTLWVRTGPLAGHYVILTDTHYVVPGYVRVPPPSYAGLGDGVTRTWGTKTGLAGKAMTCDFVSRWGAPEDPDTFSVVGPITMVRVSG